MTERESGSGGGGDRVQSKTKVKKNASRGEEIRTKVNRRRRKTK